MTSDGYDRETPVAEAMLTMLVEEFGAYAVKKHLNKIPGVRWHDWQKVSRIVDRIAKKKMK